MVAIAKSFSLDVCVTLKQPMCLVVKGTTACYLVMSCAICPQKSSMFLFLEVSSPVAERRRASGAGLGFGW